MKEMERRFAKSPDQVRDVRRWLDGLLDQHGISPQDRGTVQLAASELVTNAILHAGSDAVVRVEVGDGAIRVEVLDRSPDVPLPRDSSLAGTGGRGLQIVAAIVDEWGFRRHADGSKTVWFAVVTGTDAT